MWRRGTEQVQSNEMGVRMPWAFLKRHTWRLVRITAGLVLILIGLSGLVIPVIPGWPFIILGIIMIAPDSRLAMWLKAKWHQITTWVKKKLGRK